MPDISPYTKGIADCLESLGHEPPEKLNGNHEAAPRLINMLQGRMLEHLKTRVSSHYGLKPDSLNEEFSIALIEVFSEIFGIFRKRVEEEPWLIFHIAKRIVEVETNLCENPQKRINQFYLSVFCKYFELQNLEIIISKMQSDSRIQNSIHNAQSLEKQPLPPSSL